MFNYQICMNTGSFDVTIINFEDTKQQQNSYEILCRSKILRRASKRKVV